MLPDFQIAVDTTRSLLTVRMAGFYTMAHFLAFETAYRSAIATLCCGMNQHLVLVDTAAMQIQSQEIVAASTALARDPTIRSRRLAFVVGASLARQQTRRLVEPGREQVAFFRDHAAAEAWLFAEAVSDGRTASRYLHAPASPMSGDRGCIGRSAA